MIAQYIFLLSCMIPRAVIGGCTNSSDGWLYVSGWDNVLTSVTVINGNEITISDSEVNIPDGAFRSCNWIEKVTFKGYIEQVGSAAFRACGNLHTVIFEQGVDVIEARAFLDAQKLTNLEFHNGSPHEIHNSAFKNNVNLQIVDLSTSPGGLTFYQYAFYNCAMLESLSLPADYLVRTSDWTWFHNTPMLTCYHGPDDFLLPCSDCGEVSIESARPKCVMEEEESTSDTTLIIVFLSLSGFVSIGAVYMWNKANSIQGRVHPKPSSSEPPRLKGRAEVLLDKNQCKEALNKHNLVWDEDMEELFAIIQDAGYVTEARLYSAIDSKLRHVRDVMKETKEKYRIQRAHHRRIGVRLFYDARLHCNELKSLGDRWCEHVIPRVDGMGVGWHFELSKIEDILIAGKYDQNFEKNELGFKYHIDVTKSFLEDRIEMYYKYLNQSPDAELEILKILKLLDDRYRKTYDEIFKMRIAVGDKDAFDDWVAYVQKQLLSLSLSLSLSLFNFYST